MDFLVIADTRKEPLRLLLDLGRDFIDLEEKDECGRTALLNSFHCAPYGGEDIFYKVNLLLTRGANSQSRSNDGMSCLHHCIKWVSKSQCLNVLMLLMKTNADPWAEDNSGKSVTQCAYKTPIESWHHYQVASPGGNRGMIWEQALTACGYNAAEFRQAYLDAGGRLNYGQGDSYLYSDSECEPVFVMSDQDSEYEGESRVSYETDMEEYVPHPHSGNSESILPPFTHVPEEARYWQNPIPEDNPAPEPSVPRFQNSSDTASTQNNNFLMTNVNPTNTDPRTWDDPAQSDHEIFDNPPQSIPDSQISHPQTGNAHRSYTSSLHQSETPQPDIWPRIQELDLLEGDADVWGS